MPTYTPIHTNRVERYDPTIPIQHPRLDKVTMISDKLHVHS